MLFPPAYDIQYTIDPGEAQGHVPDNLPYPDGGWKMKELWLTSYNYCIRKDMSVSDHCLTRTENSMMSCAIPRSVLCVVVCVCVCV